MCVYPDRENDMTRYKNCDVNGEKVRVYETNEFDHDPAMAMLDAWVRKVYGRRFGFQARRDSWSAAGVNYDVTPLESNGDGSALCYRSKTIYIDRDDVAALADWMGE